MSSINFRSILTFAKAALWVLAIYYDRMWVSFFLMEGVLFFCFKNIYIYIFDEKISSGRQL